MAAAPWISEPLRPLDTVTPPAFPMPPLACDAHMHVFGPIETYPGIPGAKYTQPQGDLPEYLAVADRLHLARMVLVQASFHGTDNACILDAMARCGDRARAVVFLPDDTTPATVEALHARGVRGLRIDLFKADADGVSLPDTLARIRAAAALARPLGWHLEFYTPGRRIRDLVPHLPALGVDVVIDHMGYMTAEEGLADADFDAFLGLARTPICWIKLTGPYRIAPDLLGKQGDPARPDAMARALVAAAPDRLVWGTDWPHIPHGGRDTGELLNRLELWCPDPAQRTRILVDNPARLYGFT